MGEQAITWQKYISGSKYKVMHIVQKKIPVSYLYQWSELLMIIHEKDLEVLWTVPLSVPTQYAAVAKKANSVVGIIGKGRIKLLMLQYSIPASWCSHIWDPVCSSGCQNQNPKEGFVKLGKVQKRTANIIMELSLF